MDNDNILMTVDRIDIRILLGAAYTLYHHTKDTDISDAVMRVAKASDQTALVEKIKEILDDTSKSQRP